VNEAGGNAAKQRARALTASAMAARNTVHATKIAVSGSALP